MRTTMSRPMLKVGIYLLVCLGIALWHRDTTHAWPPPVLVGIFVAGTYTLWHKEQALEKRYQQDKLQSEAALRQGKYGARHYRA